MMEIYKEASGTYDDIMKKSGAIAHTRLVGLAVKHLSKDILKQDA